MLINMRNIQSKDPLLTKESTRNLTRIGLAWLAIAFVIAFVVRELNLDYEACQFCMAVSNYIPSISVLSKGSHDPNTMRFVLLFLTLTSPIALILISIFCRKYRRLNLQWLGYPVYLTMFLYGGYLSFYGLEFGGADSVSVLMKCYYETISCSVVSGVAHWFLLIYGAQTLFFLIVVRAIKLKHQR